jgi:monoterpene epsilon-lactone hydrolase
MTIDNSLTTSPKVSAQQLTDLYTYWGRRQTPGDDPGMDLLRDLYEGWCQFATEAEGVSFQTVDQDGIRGLWCKPATPRDGAILYVHGGGYLGGSPNGHRKLTAHIAKAAELPAFSLDYRLAPENPYPAALEDVLAAFEWIMASGVPAERIAVVGDSAGGALVTGLALHRKDAGLSLPGAIVTMSPFYDIEVKGKSFHEENKGKDPLADPTAVQGLYDLVFGAGVTLENPYLNAMASDPTGLPPVYIAMGGLENLRSGGEDFAELARSRGVEVQYEEYEDQQHVFQVLAGVNPDADRSIQNMGAFIQRHLP